MLDPVVAARVIVPEKTLRTLPVPDDAVVVVVLILLDTEELSAAAEHDTETTKAPPLPGTALVITTVLVLATALTSALELISVANRLAMVEEVSLEAAS